MAVFHLGLNGGRVVVNFDPSTLAPYFRQFPSTFSILAGTPQKIASLNSSRVKLVFAAAGANMLLMPAVAKTTPFGLLIIASTVPYEVDFSTWGGIVGLEWWASAPGGTVSATVIEVIYTPPGE